VGTNTTRLALFKPDPDPVTGDDVDVVDLNNNSDKIDAAAGFTVCTSSTRPASPWDGQPIYETDTNLFKAWVEGAWTSVGSALTLAQVYPVGSIYMATVSTSPATLFGFGTWVALESRFLVGVDGTTFPSAATGGASTKTLSTGEMPSHTHSVGTLANGNESSHTHGVGSYATNTTGSHTHDIARDHDGATGTAERTLHSTGITSGYDEQYNNQLWPAGDHSHTVSGSSAAGSAHTHTITGASASAGSGSSFSILPPYLAVYMWKRTA